MLVVMVRLGQKQEWESKLSDALWECADRFEYVDEVLNSQHLIFDGEECGRLKILAAGSFPDSLPLVQKRLPSANGLVLNRSADDEYEWHTVLKDLPGIECYIHTNDGDFPADCPLNDLLGNEIQDQDYNHDTNNKNWNRIIEVLGLNNAPSIAEAFHDVTSRVCGCVRQTYLEYPDSHEDGIQFLKEFICTDPDEWCRETDSIINELRELLVDAQDIAPMIDSLSDLNKRLKTVLVENCDKRFYVETFAKEDEYRDLLRERVATESISRRRIERIRGLKHDE